MLTMSVMLSPLRSQDPDPMATDASPMAINMTPTVEQGEGEGEEAMKDIDAEPQYGKPPPLHTAADWKIVLHLPEIETWLRMTSERVRDLTYSVQQDADSKHVDVHLVQLKDICEDISDHVEQIHALLETEFSLKLLSYSVNVIVDIHAVQLLWHQLRVSVLVLRERILQGLQDANGNYTRQTDILQAFSEETKEGRLDSLTEVDDSGQLTIKCSQNYLSLDCGITAFELSDYSPSEDLLGGLGDMTSSQAKTKPFDSWSYSEMEKEFPELIRSVGLLTVAADPVPSSCEAASEGAPQEPLSEENKGEREEHSASTSGEQPGSTSGMPSLGDALTNAAEHPSETAKQDPSSSPQLGAKKTQSVPCEIMTPKRSIRDCFNYNEDSPTQPTRPKRGLFLKETRMSERKGSDGKRQLVDLNPELSRSTPSLVDPPDRSKLCLILQSSYPSSPSAASQSYECLHKVGIGNLENIVRSHIKEISSSLGRLTDCHKEKSRLKKPHKTLTEVPLCRTSKRGTGSGTQAQTTKGSAVPSMVPPGAPKDTVRPETDSASTSSFELPHQRNWSRLLPAQSEVSSSPPRSHSSESSVGSDSSRAPGPLLSESESQKDGSPAPSHITQSSQEEEAWYGSDEYLALPSHLKQTEVLALKLESLTKLLPPKPRETVQNIDDWELSEMNSDSEIYPTYHSRRKHTRLGRVSPSSSSDIASSLGESIESGPLSDILSDEDLCVPLSCMKKYTDEKTERPSSSEKNRSHSATKSALIQKLMQDIRHQDNYEAIWERIEGFVNKLDEFIQWLHEAMETTENWTPPKAETDSLRLYLETHLSFKLNVDSHCALKEAVEEEGHQLLELIASHKAGLKDMLKMIASQWKELQRQIKRQHSWILKALDTIKAEILATDVSVEDEEGTGSPKAEVRLCYLENLEAQRDAVEQMSLKLYSEQYSSSSKRKEEFADMSKTHSVGSNGLLDFDSEYQELWDWLIDMESLVMDSHDLMMSEEQQQHLYKRYSVEMSIRHPKKTELLSKVDALRKGGVSLPNDLLEKVDSINEKWELLGKTLREKIQDPVAGQSASGPRDLLSPESGSLVRQLEVRIKELKRWLRDTELLIFNSCLRQEKEAMSAEKQLQYFKSLCHEIKQRRRGVASILRLCQHLLDDRDTCNLNADHQPMQLIIVNLERRWEAIVMQAVQWQTRLQKKMGKEPESLNVIDPGLMDLNGMSEDALEWDETDISNKLISLHEEPNDLDQDPEPLIPSVNLEETRHQDPGYEEEAGDCGSQYTSNITAPSSPHVYQVYSLHNVELHKDSHTPFLKSSPKPTGPAQPGVLTKSLSMDSSFSSTKSLPDLLGGTSLVRPCPCHSGDVSQNSGSESGIVSEGDNEMLTNSEMCLFGMVDGSPSNPETEHLDPQMGDAVNVLKQKFKDRDECIKLPNISQSSVSAAGCVNGKAGDLNSGTKHTTDCLGEELQGKHDVFTFYDYSYLQGSKLKLPMIMKQSQSEKAHVEDPLLCGFYFDKKSCRSKHQAPELQPDAPPHERILASAPHEMGGSSYKSCDKEKTLAGVPNARQLSLVSRSSSVESLSPEGDLFGLGVFKNGSDSLQRSSSLESWWTSYKSNEDLFSCHSSGDISVSSGSVGELSKRTLDLLNRLENIQSPSEQKIKRSVSDITLQSSSQRMSFTGQMSLDVASSINEDSAASLTELSSSEELSLCSEDIVLHKNKVPESNASFRKRLNRSVADESDVNVSMIVNVSCTSACTDDEDDSDLLSSSTLTLTEEELCLKDEDDDSSIATDDEIYEESHLMSGLDYIKKELQTWVRPKFSLAREKKRCGAPDEMKGDKDGGRSEKVNPSDTLNIQALLNGSIKCLSENNGNGRNSLRTHDLGTEGENKKNIYEVSKDPHVADVENGNIESAPERQKEKQNGTSEASENLGLDVKQSSDSEHSECRASVDSSEDSNVAGKEFRPPRDRHLPQTGPNLHHCENESAPCMPDESPCPDLLSGTRVGSRQDSDGLKALSNDAPSGAGKSAGCCLLGQNETEESASISNSTSCCHCQPDVSHEKDAEDCSVHDFVKEIIGMASTALKSKSQPESEVAAPTSLTQIKEKVLEHSHRPMPLRKGDFYSYLSLSSHDSDCGEVTNYIDEKSTTPLPPDAVDFSLDDKEDIECFFEACVEDDLDEKACFSSPLPDEPAAPQEAAMPIQVTASSPVFSDVAFPLNETDTVALPGPSPQKGGDNGKEVDDASQTPQGCAKSSALTTPSGQPSKDGGARNQGESGMPEGNNATSAKSKIQALPLNAKQPKVKTKLYPSPQTLTCKEKLVNFHEDRHRNMHR